jgi:hypothetical protein
MTSFSNTPKLVSGGLVLVHPKTAQIQQVIALQYNPETLLRSLQVQGAGAESGDRIDALRLKGAPIETIKLEAEFDAIDQLERPSENPQVVALGLHPVLAALESIVYPAADSVQSNIDLASFGTIEITPVEAPLTLFVWSAQRIVPVRITEMSITEEAFDTNLNPIRARVSLAMRVLNVNDLALGHRGAGIFFAHHREKERMAKSVVGELSRLGVGRIP